MSKDIELRIQKVENKSKHVCSLPKKVEDLAMTVLYNEGTVNDFKVKFANIEEQFKELIQENVK